MKRTAAYRKARLSKLPHEEALHIENIVAFKQALGRKGRAALLAIDAMREEYGMRGFFLHEQLTDLDIRKIQTGESQESCDFLNFLDGLPTIQHAVVFLRIIWGFQLKEIGLIFRRSEAWANLEFKAAMKNLRLKFAAEHQGLSSRID